MKKEEKTLVVSELQEKFEKAKGVVITDYRGLNVEEMGGLRNLLRSSGIEYKVVKNTLARLAARGTSVDGAKDIFSGPIGIAVGYDDPALLVKKVLEYSKTNEKLEIKGGVVEGTVCTPEQIAAIAKLPSREVLLSVLIGTMQSPLSKMAGLLNSTVAQFMYALEALKQKKEQSG